MKFVPESAAPSEPKVELEETTKRVISYIKYPDPDPKDYLEEQYYEDDLE